MRYMIVAFQKFIYSSQVILSQPKLKKRHTPNLEKHKIYDKKYHAFKKLYSLIETMEI